MPYTCAQQQGFTSASFSSFDTSGLNNDNEISANGFTPGFPCRVYWLWVYFGGNGQTTNARLVAWQGGGGIAGRSAQFTAPSGAASTGGQALNSQPADGISLLQAGAQAVFLGFWRDAGKSSIWSVTASGSFFHKTDTSGDVDSFSGAAACGAPYVCGNLQAYCEIVGGDAKALGYGLPYFRAARR